MTAPTSFILDVYKRQITTRGLKEDKMEEIVALIDRVLSDPENEANIAAVRKEVNAMMANYCLLYTSLPHI